MTAIRVAAFRTAHARRAPFAALLTWAAFQTFWRLDQASVQIDEPVYVRAGWQYLHGHFGANREHPPTAKYLMGLAELVHGSTSIGAARLAVATVSFAAGLVTFWWLRRVLGGGRGSSPPPVGGCCRAPSERCPR